MFAFAPGALRPMTLGGVGIDLQKAPGTALLFDTPGATIFELLFVSDYSARFSGSGNLVKGDSA